MLSILIVEDEFIIGRHLQKLLTTLGYRVTGHALDATRALELLAKDPPDLVVLDISLGGKMDGIEVAAIIDEEHRIPYIFLTSHSDPKTLARAKEVNPGAYLTKPFKKEDLYSAIEMSISNFAKRVFPEQNKDEPQNASDPDSGTFVLDKAIFVKLNRVLTKLRFSEISYVRSDRVYLEIFMTDKTKVVVRDSISSFADKLPESFVRVHRSYIINLDFLESIGTQDILVGEMELPLGKAYRENLLKKIRH